MRGDAADRSLRRARPCPRARHPGATGDVRGRPRRAAADWAEQDPDEWWSALAKAVPQAIAEGDISPAEIAGISVDATSSTVLAVDADGRALRPAILWMDVRAFEQADRVAGTGHPALKYNGHGAVRRVRTAESALDTRQRAGDLRAREVHPRLRRLDHAAIDAEKHSIDQHRDVQVLLRSGCRWLAAELYEKAGAPDLLEKLPQDVLITGSSHVIIAQSAEPAHDPGFWGAYTDAMIPGLYTIEAGQASTGSIVAWFKNQLAGGVEQEAKQRGVDAYELLAEMAQEVPVGSEWPARTRLLQGNRAPHTDPRARGAISGLSLSHGPGHLFRAIIEGICYGTEDILQTMRSRDFVPKRAVVSGGPAKSDLWMQTHADVSNMPLTFPKVSEGPVLGAAIQASVGAGIHPDLPTAAKSMVQLERVEARPEDCFWVRRYRELYGAIRDAQHEVVEHLGREPRDAAA